MPRALWKGHLSFGLIMIPVELISGEVSTASLDLDMIDSRDSARIRYKRVNEKTGKEVPWESIVRGFEYAEGKYAVLTPQDFKRAAADVVRGAEIIDFVDAGAISPIYFEKPYYLQPSKGGDKAYSLLRDVLRKTRRIGVAHLVIQAKQHLAALMVQNDLLTLITLRWDQELLDPGEIKAPQGRAGAVSAREVAMAEQLVNGMYTKWDASRYHDEYTKALRKFITARSKSGKKVIEERVEQEQEVAGPYNIMDLLKKSVEGRTESKVIKHKNNGHAKRTGSRRAG